MSDKFALLDEDDGFTSSDEELSIPYDEDAEFRQTRQSSATFRRGAAPMPVESGDDLVGFKGSLTSSSNIIDARDSLTKPHNPFDALINDEDHHPLTPEEPTRHTHLTSRRNEVYLKGEDLDKLRAESTLNNHF